jgi:hypothetical protein
MVPGTARRRMMALQSRGSAREAARIISPTPASSAPKAHEVEGSSLNRATGDHQWKE